VILYNHREREIKHAPKRGAKEQKMKKVFPKEIILMGERFRIKGECFNPDLLPIDLEDLWIEGTMAEGRWFFANIISGKLVKYNKHREDEWVRFEPDYEDGVVETIVARRRNDIDNPVYYFLIP